MNIKELIMHSNVEVNDDHTSIDCNAIPTSGISEINNEPCLVFADDFIRELGDSECNKVNLSEIENDELPEELKLNEHATGKDYGMGTPTDYEWYKTYGKNAYGRQYPIYFGIW